MLSSGGEAAQPQKKLKGACLFCLSSGAGFGTRLQREKHLIFFRRGSSGCSVVLGPRLACAGKVRPGESEYFPSLKNGDGFHSHAPRRLQVPFLLQVCRGTLLLLLTKRFSPSFTGSPSFRSEITFFGVTLRIFVVILRIFVVNVPP